MAAVASCYEERRILALRFAQEHKSYRGRTPFLLPPWGWHLWGMAPIAGALGLF
jgi:hypothetical protein